MRDLARQEQPRGSPSKPALFRPLSSFLGIGPGTVWHFRGDYGDEMAILGYRYQYQHLHQSLDAEQRGEMTSQYYISTLQIVAHHYFLQTLPPPSSGISIRSQNTSKQTLPSALRATWSLNLETTRDPDGDRGGVLARYNIEPDVVETAWLRFLRMRECR